ncbi:hypothetical protein DFJ74DRAFT_683359 [Hyaloraphidium curvatum]|nr:hypothetical protein DFJ74DRAFT_683359 [Hyaloraphidium curvatum]
MGDSDAAAPRPTRAEVRESKILRLPGGGPPQDSDDDLPRKGKTVHGQSKQSKRVRAAKRDSSDDDYDPFEHSFQSKKRKNRRAVETSSSEDSEREENLIKGPLSPNVRKKKGKASSKLDVKIGAASPEAKTEETSSKPETKAGKVKKKRAASVPRVLFAGAEAQVDGMIEVVEPDDEASTDSALVLSTRKPCALPGCPGFGADKGVQLPSGNRMWTCTVGCAEKLKKQLKEGQLINAKARRERARREATEDNQIRRALEKFDSVPAGPFSTFQGYMDSRLQPTDTILSEALIVVLNRYPETKAWLEQPAGGKDGYDARLKLLRAMIIKDFQKSYITQKMGQKLNVVPPEGLACSAPGCPVTWADGFGAHLHVGHGTSPHEGNETGIKGVNLSQTLPNGTVADRVAMVQEMQLPVGPVCVTHNATALDTNRGKHNAMYGERLEEGTLDELDSVNLESAQKKLRRGCESVNCPWKGRDDPWQEDGPAAYAYASDPEDGEDNPGKYGRAYRGWQPPEEFGAGAFFAGVNFDQLLASASGLIEGEDPFETSPAAATRAGDGSYRPHYDDLVIKFPEIPRWAFYLDRSLRPGYAMHESVFREAVRQVLYGRNPPSPGDARFLLDELRKMQDTRTVMHEGCHHAYDAATYRKSSIFKNEFPKATAAVDAIALFERGVGLTQDGKFRRQGHSDCIYCCIDSGRGAEGLWCGKCDPENPDRRPYLCAVAWIAQRKGEEAARERLRSGGKDGSTHRDETADDKCNGRCCPCRDLAPPLLCTMCENHAGKRAMNQCAMWPVPVEAHTPDFDASGYNLRLAQGYREFKLNR